MKEYKRQVNKIEKNTTTSKQSNELRKKKHNRLREVTEKHKRLIKVTE